MDLNRRTAWLNHTKNGTPRGVPLNQDAVAILIEQLGKHGRYCFTYQGQPIKWELSNSAWHGALAKPGIQDFRFHDLRLTWLHGIEKPVRHAMNEKTWAAGSHARWWIAMRSMQRNICRQRPRESSKASEMKTGKNASRFCHVQKRQGPRLVI